MNKMMVLKGGSLALHKTGDISRECDDFIRIYEETDEYYIGNFEEGFGFVDVKFQKSDCRPLTEDEIKKLNNTWYTINGTPRYRICLDSEGNVIEGNDKKIKGIITKVEDNNGNLKNENWHNTNVDFYEDIPIGKSLVMFTNSGTISTSKVKKFTKTDSQYIIYTKNSVYYIDTIE